MEIIWNIFTQTWKSQTIRETVTLVIISLIFLTVIYGTKIFLLRYIIKRHVPLHTRYRWNKVTNYTSHIIAGLLLILLWLPSIRTFMTVLSIFGAGFIIVHKEVILNISGFVYILVRRPFEESNRIALDGITGDVIDIRIQDFSMLEVKSRSEGGQSTGRILHIPNSRVFTSTIANASKEFSFNWDELKIHITPKSNWKKAVTILEEIADIHIEEISDDDKRIRHSEEHYSIRYANLKPAVFVDMRDGAIVLTLRHLTEPRKTRVISDYLWREILTRFAKEKTIHFVA